MKNRLFLFLAVTILSCNPFPKKDSHPEAPLLEDLLKDKNKFEKIFDTEKISNVVFLKDNKIFLKPKNGNEESKIIDVNNAVIFNQVVDLEKPIYFDKAGNLYVNEQKYFHPNYREKQPFKTIVFKDSLSKKIDELGSKYSDSVKSKMLVSYELEILKPYQLKPCEYTIVNTELCDVFEIRNHALIVRQDELFKSKFTKPSNDVTKFDDDVLIKWQNGRVASPVYLAYHKINDLKFKCDDMTMPKTINLNGKLYLFTYRHGLYLVKNAN